LSHARVGRSNGWGGIVERARRLRQARPCRRQLIFAVTAAPGRDEAHSVAIKFVLAGHPATQRTSTPCAVTTLKARSKVAARAAPSSNPPWPKTARGIVVVAAVLILESLSAPAEIRLGRQQHRRLRHIRVR
jgi:hypothetical protein